MSIRGAVRSDMDTLVTLYNNARAAMAAAGNPNQWINGYPQPELIEQDIRQQKSYVCIRDGGIAAVFFFDFGENIDPCYDVIEDGEWLDPSPYGVVHRIAAADEGTGAGGFCINWAFEQCGHLRMDTHSDNKVMRNLLSKLGFQRRGIIYIVEDNDPRIAYEKSSLLN